MLDPVQPLEYETGLLRRPEIAGDIEIPLPLPKSLYGHKI